MQTLDNLQLPTEVKSYIKALETENALLKNQRATSEYMPSPCDPCYKGHDCANCLMPTIEQ